MVTLAPSRGVCFGFDIRSDLDLRYLRERGPAADGLPPLEVTLSNRDESSSGADEALVYDWAPPQAPFRAQLRKSEDRFSVWIEHAGRFEVDPGGRRVALPPAVEPIRREERLWGVPSMLCFLHRGDTPLHGAAVEIDGAAVILGGTRRAGKTTLAAALASAGHRLLAEDLSCVRDGSPPLIVPGPAMLRLRHDVADRLDLLVAHEILGRDDDRVHIALSGAVRGDGSPLPVAAVVMLAESDSAPRLERVAPLDALARLWPLSFNLPDDADRARCFGALVDLAERVPVWLLHRRLQLSDLAPAIERVREAVGRG